MVCDPHVPVSLRIRVHHAGLFAFGPGKADLLEAIEACQSISGAGRSLGLSYTKTRRLLDELNGSFREPMVESARGGAQGGRAWVTPTGQRVLAAFRAMERRALEVVQEDLGTILAELAPPAATR
jgi:molybdate transport system regulatory protein